MPSGLPEAYALPWVKSSLSPVQRRTKKKKEGTTWKLCKIIREINETPFNHYLSRRRNDQRIIRVYGAMFNCRARSE